MYTTIRTSSIRTSSRARRRTREVRRFPWHALAVTVAAAVTVAGAVLPDLLNPPEAVAEPARQVAFVVLFASMPLVAIAAVLAERRPALGLPILRDAAYLAAVVALCTLADPGVRVLVLVIAVIGMFAWGAPRPAAPPGPE